MDDDTIVQQRITGRSVRAIAKLQGVSLAQVNAAIDRWAELQIDDKLRKYTLALELARLDQLQQVLFSRAMNGDVSCGALVTKIIERRCTVLGLHTPQTAVLQIVDEATPKETSTDRIECALAKLMAQRKDGLSSH